MQSTAPGGSGGNGIYTTKYPYGVTSVKYFPSGSSSVGRSMWDGWRYGAGYVGPNEGKVYGEPDYKYYRHNYCGPCGCGCPPEGSPNGKNPNIRHIQLDYKSLLGSGFAQQGLGQSQTSQLRMGQGQLPPTHTSCGREHCTHCSGVFKKKEQDVKFQVCIGDPECPETMPPCPRQDVKVYVPNQMLPGPQVTDQDGSGDGGCDQEKKLPDFEVQIPGYTDCPSPSQGAGAAPAKSNVWESVDPCGNCKACKTSTNTASLKPSPFLVRSSQKSKLPAPCCQNCTKCNINGQLYTNGPVLCNIKKPTRPTVLRKTLNYC
ncbi:uncharacterized protein LOC110848857 isoform X2 [Folsomia candida]|uniref:uncharacterized protein LOC110848857 isoform X2 n=1 Tax=Folsomia candida TaxID=158441 RepID=UPI000B902AC4|nr:uncharacterized protein LOC110848857 isoform X2 [Folsomia candida]